MYHYTECGLENAWLKNGYRTVETPYGAATSIADADGLNQAIALSLIEKKGPLDGKELRFLRLALELTQLQLGALLGAKEQTISLWERKGSITPTADMMVRLLTAEKLEVQPQPHRMAACASRVDAIQEKIVASARQHRWSATLTKDEGLVLAE